MSGDWYKISVYPNDFSDISHENLSLVVILPSSTDSLVKGRRAVYVCCLIQHPGVTAAKS